MSQGFAFLSDPDEALVGQLFKYQYTKMPKDTTGFWRCSICGEAAVNLQAGQNYENQEILAHLRNACCKPFVQNIKALQLAQREGTTLAPVTLTLTTTSGQEDLKTRCAQLELYLRLAVTELERAGNPLARDTTIRQMVEQSTTMSTKIQTTSTSSAS